MTTDGGAGGVARERVQLPGISSRARASWPGRTQPREAAASYKQKFDESADALTKLLRGFGEEAVAAGQRIADRVRAREN